MKKLTVYYLLATLLMAFGLSSCEIIESGLEPRHPEDKHFNLSGFDKLEMGDGFQVEVKQSANYRIFVKGDRRDIDDLVVRVSGGQLKMYFSKWRAKRYRMEVEIEMPDLKETDFSGAVNAYVKGFNNLDQLYIDLSGASKATFVTQAKGYDIDLSGASDLIIEGNGKNLEAEISGASKLYAFDADIEKANLDVSGASSAKVTVSNNLRVSASGASKVRYRGNPVVSSNTSGSSHVEKD
ncbi:head GIN domain-containing protein [Emticicia sp. 21SJ11W-3]|uniref:head GIN domain-containing protein n=1 Tax=Emticicia sp. 21SJ11W-3 TaxID=2916755 RepID=UPI00209D0C57|nr:head GIN domain-containing protein [Emticicia sp. 21SJ11W-3]UTA66260.1 DUF2807 domain-containing protein [Emticicia sp. 21SJ11W-3]